MSLRFDQVVSFGNLISVGAVIGTGLVVWGTLNADVENQERRLTGTEQVVASFDARLRIVEKDQAGTAADVRAIQAGISRMETKLDDLIRQARNP